MERRPERTVYAITDESRTLLRAWLGATPAITGTGGAAATPARLRTY
jgi:hypothetical protein